MLAIYDYPDEASSLRGSYPLNIFVALGGSGVVQLHSLLFGAVAGRAFFYGNENRFSVMEKHGLQGVLFSFDHVLLDYFLLHYPLARDLELFGRSVYLDVDQGHMALMRERIGILRDELGRSLGPDRLKLVFCLFMLEVASGRVGLGRPLDHKAWRNAKFRALLDEHFRGNRSLGFYAGRMGLSKLRLNSLCRQWYDGKAFFEVLMDRLFLEADHRLIHTDDQIKVIASDLGFESSQGFRACFLRYRGITPLEFRHRGRINLPLVT